MGESNTFRDRCWSTLEEIVERSASWFSSMETHGDRPEDVYIHAVIQPGDVEVWIDSDMVEYSTGPETFRFEVASYKQEDRLIQEFSSEFSKDLAAISGSTES